MANQTDAASVLAFEPTFHEIAQPDCYSSPQAICRPTPRPPSIEIESPEKIEVPVKAYMPGVVAFCEKSTGDAVEKGEVILILEAMKMENLIMAPMCGRVLSLAVKEGEKVGRGTLLAIIG